jgi:integrase/recombinase XerD
MSDPSATRRRRRARCSTCLAPLVKGGCSTHGQRNADGTSLCPSANKGKRFPAEPLTKDEMAALLKACSQRSPTGIRNAAMITTLWRSGIRVGELLALRPKDIDHSAGHLTVLHGKGDKRRTVGIDSGALVVINRWLDTRKALEISGHRPLFCTLTGQPIDATYPRAMIKRLAKRAGIERRVHPHSLRHTHSYELAMEGRPLIEIQAQLGHSNAAVTSRYIDHIAPKQVVEMIRARPSWLDDDED